MFSLTNVFEDSFDYEDLELHVDMSFDNILRIFELSEDETFPAYEKVLLVLEMLIIEYELIQDVEHLEQFEIYEYLMEEFLGLSTKNKDGEDKKPSKRVMDFRKDAGPIYASFLSEYGIDLFERQGKLHWDKFSELLRELGDKTAFKQIVKYRTMKVPSAKEASKEYRDHVQKLKRTYSLEDDTGKQESMENTLDTIASTFGKGR